MKKERKNKNKIGKNNKKKVRIIKDGRRKNIIKGRGMNTMIIFPKNGNLQEIILLTTSSVISQKG